MSFKKKMLAVAAVSALTVATAVPAMALENEFHGMYKFFGYESNFFNGNTYVTPAVAATHMDKDSHSGFIGEQRARIMYTAKANDNLKLVTHFELDTRFGGLQATGTGYKGTTSGNDSGNLDADQLTLETKNIYLDFNCPITGANLKVGVQPWADSYKSLFLLADMSGVYATKKFDPLTVSLGWFRFDDQDALNGVAGTVTGVPGKKTADLIVADAKFAISKDLTLGASYYNVQNDSGKTAFELLHMLGVNASAKVGPAAVDAFAAYQFGDQNAKDNISAFLLGATGKVNVGPGNVNLAAIYLSGDGNGTGDAKDFKTISGPTTYFNPANMWLLIRNGQAVNSSTSVLGTDNTVNGRGMIGLFAGFDGKVDKLFYNANLGWAQTAKARGTEKKSLGTELNAQVGYNLYDNLAVSLAAAYLVVGDGLGGSATQRISGFGAVDADNVYMTNVQLSYAF